MCHELKHEHYKQLCYYFAVHSDTFQCKTIVSIKDNVFQILVPLYCLHVFVQIWKTKYPFPG